MEKKKKVTFIGNNFILLHLKHFDNVKNTMKLLKHSSDKIFYETTRYIRGNKLTRYRRISTQYFIFFDPSLANYSSTKNKKENLHWTKSEQKKQKKNKKKNKKTLKYSISKREKNKIYYTSIKVKKHEEKHSKLGRPKKLQKKLKKKNCYTAKLSRF